MASADLTRWIKRLKTNPWPAFLAQTEVQDNASSINELTLCIQKDPLLASWVFKHAGHLYYQASSLKDAITFLGIPKTIEACRTVPRIDQYSPKYKGLLQAVGDSILAAELLQRWFNKHNFGWQEKDYWTALYDSVIIWAMWWLEPTLMEGFDFRRTQGDRVHILISDYLDSRYLQVLETINKEWHLPISLNLREQAKDNDNITNGRRAHSLIFFLPYSFEVAQTCRQPWVSTGFKEVIKKGEQALSSPDFISELKIDLIEIAQSHPFIWVSSAARRLTSHQPPLYLDEWTFAETEPHQGKGGLSTFHKITAHMRKKPSPYFDIEELNHAFANACIAGLDLERTMIWQYDLHYQQFTYCYGENKVDQYFPSFDRFDLADSQILTKIMQRPTSALINAKNSKNVMPNLPTDFRQLLNTDEFMVKSIISAQKGSFLLIADHKDLDNETYTRFRELGTAYGQCLTNLSDF